MNLASEFYPALESVRWLSSFGKPLPTFDFNVVRFADLQAAEGGFRSDLWADVKTEAQGDLTGYLAKHHYSAYGGHWNNLAKQSRLLVEKAAGAKIGEALAQAGLPADMLQPILVDVNRAALEISYQRKFPKAPIFFERLLRIYEAGHLPCGWDGKMNRWPAGNLMAF